MINELKKHVFTETLLCLATILFFLGCSSNSQPVSTPDERAANEAQQFLFVADYDKAIEAYTKAIELNGNQAEYYLNRGIAYKGKLQNEAAIADFNRAIEILPTMSAAFYNRGKVYEIVGNIQQAKVDFDAAEKLSAAK